MNTAKQIAKRIFQYEAKLVLAKYKPIIIAITGSVGKTVTREMIYSVLSKKHFVRKSEKSFTAEFGIPLAILGCSEANGSFLHFIKNIFIGFLLIIKKSDYPDWLILEIDFDRPGDLKAVSSFLSPDILIMTTIGEVPSHIESFPDIESFMLEEEYIIDSVKRDGLIIYNADDARVSRLLQNKMVRTVSCGMGRMSEVYGDDFEILYSKNKTTTSPTGMSFEVSHKSNKYKVNIFGSIGVHNEYAALLAFATGIELQIPPTDIISLINKYKPIAGRMNIISGIRDAIIIDDSYNASPVATQGAIEVFKKLNSSGKKIVVIGDMLELGRFSAEEHKKIGELLKDRVNIVICVGLRSRKISEEILGAGIDQPIVMSVDSSEEASRELLRLLEPNDIILVKGSQAIRLERVVEAVMRHPEDKNKLLVRQEPNWLSRE